MELDLEIVATGLRFPEGPIAMPDGSVVLVEIARGTLTRVQPDGTTEVIAELGGGPNGAAIGPDGRCYVCNNGGFEWTEIMGLLIPGHQPDDYTGGKIQAVDLDSGAFETLYDSSTDEHGGVNPLCGPNDIVFDTHGGFWFTDLGKTRHRDMDQGGIYYAQPDGSSIREVVHPVNQPNGIGLSPDGSRLYVAQTMMRQVIFFDVTGPGELALDPMSPFPGTVLVGLGGQQLLDSLAIDADGSVCVATIGNGGITVVPSDANERADAAGLGSGTLHHPMPDLLTTNICFGGDDFRTAWITLSATGQLARCRWPSEGLRLAHER